MPSLGFGVLLWEEHTRQREEVCKGPEGEMSLVLSRCSQKVLVAKTE